jgi:hypothetical protein
MGAGGDWSDDGAGSEFKYPLQQTKRISRDLCGRRGSPSSGTNYRLRFIPTGLVLAAMTFASGWQINGGRSDRGPALDQEPRGKEREPPMHQPKKYNDW